MNTTTENIKGTVKEAIGSAVGDDGLEREGEQQQKKAREKEEAEELREKAEQKDKKATGHAGAESAADGVE